MAKRKRIGLVFSYNENWIAGSYYIMNIVHALNSLSKKERPFITIISDDIANFKLLKKETGYPYLSFFQFPNIKVNYSILERMLNKFTLAFFQRKLVNKSIIYPNLDFLYPNEIEKLRKKYTHKFKKVNWIPDFQEEHLPHFFSEEEINGRKKFQKEIVCKGDVAVFSSEDAQKDFSNLYSESSVNRFVLKFAVTHPKFENLQIDELLRKYSLPENYFFSPNQFWAHKNHMVILEAVKSLEEKGKEVFVVFSGKENDYRNSENFNKLKNYISNNDLIDRFKFLGFIPREDQLSLMKYSNAVIQPSLFEGWSTVVEDAKALNKFIILSDLNVHKEQINENVHFFNPKNHVILADILDKYYKNKPTEIHKDYNNNVSNFAKDFMNLVNLAMK